MNAPFVQEDVRPYTNVARLPVELFRGVKLDPYKLHHGHISISLYTFI